MPGAFVATIEDMAAGSRPMESPSRGAADALDMPATMILFPPNP